MDTSRYVNPYIAGSPVTGTEMFFGREDVFSFVRRNLTGRHRDTPIVLYGQRRTGKTSVLYQMHRHVDSRYRCIFIDLHGLNLNGTENLLWGLATSISRGLQRDHQLSVAVPDRAKFSASPHTAFEATFLDTVWSVLGRDHLLLMIDEIVRLHEEVRAGRLEPEVFDYLRHLMQHFERLNFVFSLGSGVEEMKKDYAFLFGVALYHRISFLEPAAARALITRPAQDCYQVLPDAVEKILQITSGHPYYTQLVCHCLFDRWLRASKPQMTSADVDAILAEAIELGSANLTYVWEDSTPGEQAMMAGMAAATHTGASPVTVNQIRDVWRKLEVPFPASEAASAARNLTTREVVMASEGAYSFAVDLQRLWLDKHRRLDWVKEELADAVGAAFLHAGLERAEAVQRKARRRRIQAFTALSALLALALLAAGALAQRQTAVRQQRIATARQLIAEAEAARATHPPLALRLGIAAQRIENSPETRTSLVNTLNTTDFADALTGPKVLVKGVAYAPDASTLATASSDKTARLLNVRDPARPRPFGPPLRHKGQVFAVAFAPDGRTLATGNYEDGTSIWSVADRDRPRLLTRLAPHTESVFAVAFAPDGRTLASGMHDNSVRLWDVADRRHPRLLTRLTGYPGLVDAVAFAPDGRTLATGGADNTVMLWDVADRGHPRLLTRLTGHTGPVYSVAFAPDGRTLATGGADNTVRIWDITDRGHPRLLTRQTGYPGPVFAVAFAPDGRTLATGGAGGQVVLWDLARLNDFRNRPLQYACTLAGRGFNRNEWARYVPGLPYQNTCPP